MCQNRVYVVKINEKKWVIMRLLWVRLLWVRRMTHNELWLWLIISFMCMGNGRSTFNPYKKYKKKLFASYFSNVFFLTLQQPYSLKLPLPNFASERRTCCGRPLIQLNFPGHKVWQHFQLFDISIVWRLKIVKYLKRRKKNNQSTHLRGKIPPWHCSATPRPKKKTNTPKQSHNPKVEPLKAFS